MHLPTVGLTSTLHHPLLSKLAHTIRHDARNSLCRRANGQATLFDVLIKLVYFGHACLHRSFCQY